MKRAHLYSAIGLVTALGLVACNTIRGAGRDVSAGGAVVSNTAEHVQGSMSSHKAKQNEREEAKRRAALRRSQKAN